ncbi:uncharacterized protein LOC125177877 [Hyalella azteca]|uniref:Uncharacterized protein LOC125177877 n=1 Tax=Hyalella azteca TaxID=294128 RepID=A0A979FIJ2_HYAAZ|nr:uncharacterized protein LOC125177877 [Hyalella azteca]
MDVSKPNPVLPRNCDGSRDLELIVKAVPDSTEGAVEDTPSRSIHGKERRSYSKQKKSPNLSKSFRNLKKFPLPAGEHNPGNESTSVRNRRPQVLDTSKPVNLTSKFSGDNVTKSRCKETSGANLVKRSSANYCTSSSKFSNIITAVDKECVPQQARKGSHSGLLEQATCVKSEKPTPDFKSTSNNEKVERNKEYLISYRETIEKVLRRNSSPSHTARNMLKISQKCEIETAASSLKSDLSLNLKKQAQDESTTSSLVKGVSGCDLVLSYAKPGPSSESGYGTPHVDLCVVKSEIVPKLEFSASAIKNIENSRVRGVKTDSSGYRPPTKSKQKISSKIPVSPRMTFKGKLEDKVSCKRAVKRRKIHGFTKALPRNEPGISKFANEPIDKSVDVNNTVQLPRAVDQNQGPSKEGTFMVSRQVFKSPLCSSHELSDIKSIDDSQVSQEAKAVQIDETKSDSPDVSCCSSAPNSAVQHSLQAKPRNQSKSRSAQGTVYSCNLPVNLEVNGSIKMADDSKMILMFTCSLMSILPPLYACKTNYFLRLKILKPLNFSTYTLPGNVLLFKEESDQMTLPYLKLIPFFSTGGSHNLRPLSIAGKTIHLIVNTMADNYDQFPALRNAICLENDFTLIVIYGFDRYQCSRSIKFSSAVKQPKARVLWKPTGKMARESPTFYGLNADHFIMDPRIMTAKLSLQRDSHIRRHRMSDQWRKWCAIQPSVLIDRAQVLTPCKRKKADPASNRRGKRSNISPPSFGRCSDEISDPGPSSVKSRSTHSESKQKTYFKPMSHTKSPSKEVSMKTNTVSDGDAATLLQPFRHRETPQKHPQTNDSPTTSKHSDQIENIVESPIGPNFGQKFLSSVTEVGSVRVAGSGSISPQKHQRKFDENCRMEKLSDNVTNDANSQFPSLVRSESNASLPAASHTMGGSSSVMPCSSQFQTSSSHHATSNQPSFESLLKTPSPSSNKIYNTIDDGQATGDSSESAELDTAAHDVRAKATSATSAKTTSAADAKITSAAGAKANGAAGAKATSAAGAKATGAAGAKATSAAGAKTTAAGAKATGAAGAKATGVADAKANGAASAKATSANNDASSEVLCVSSGSPSCTLKSTPRKLSPLQLYALPRHSSPIQKKIVALNNLYEPSVYKRDDVSYRMWTGYNPRLVKKEEKAIACAKKEELHVCMTCDCRVSGPVYMFRSHLRSKLHYTNSVTSLRVMSNMICKQFGRHLPAVDWLAASLDTVVVREEVKEVQGMASLTASLQANASLQASASLQTLERGSERITSTTAPSPICSPTSTNDGPSCSSTPTSTNDLLSCGSSTSVLRHTYWHELVLIKKILDADLSACFGATPTVPQATPSVAQATPSVAQATSSVHQKPANGGLVSAHAPSRCQASHATKSRSSVKRKFVEATNLQAQNSGLDQSQLDSEFHASKGEKKRKLNQVESEPTIGVIGNLPGTSTDCNELHSNEVCERPQYGCGDADGSAVETDYDEAAGGFCMVDIISSEHHNPSHTQYQMGSSPFVQYEASTHMPLEEDNYDDSYSCMCNAVMNMTSSSLPAAPCEPLANFDHNFESAIDGNQLQSLSAARETSTVDANFPMNESGENVYADLDFIVNEALDVVNTNHQAPHGDLAQPDKDANNNFQDALLGSVLNCSPDDKLQSIAKQDLINAPRSGADYESKHYFDLLSEISCDDDSSSGMDVDPSSSFNAVRLETPVLLNCAPSSPLGIDHDSGYPDAATDEQNLRFREDALVVSRNYLEAGIGCENVEFTYSCDSDCTNGSLDSHAGLIGVSEIQPKNNEPNNENQCMDNTKAGYLSDEDELKLFLSSDEADDLPHINNIEALLPAEDPATLESATIPKSSQFTSITIDRESLSTSLNNSLNSPNVLDQCPPSAIDSDLSDEVGDSCSTHSNDAVNISFCVDKEEVGGLLGDRSQTDKVDSVHQPQIKVTPHAPVSETSSSHLICFGKTSSPSSSTRTPRSPLRAINTASKPRPLSKRASLLRPILELRQKLTTKKNDSCGLEEIPIGSQLFELISNDTASVSSVNLKKSSKADQNSKSFVERKAQNLDNPSTKKTTFESPFVLKLKAQSKFIQNSVSDHQKQEQSTNMNNNDDETAIQKHSPSILEKQESLEEGELPPSDGKGIQFENDRGDDLLDVHLEDRTSSCGSGSDATIRSKSDANICPAPNCCSSDASRSSSGVGRPATGTSRRSASVSRRSSGASRRSPGASRHSSGGSHRSPGASRRSSGASRRSSSASRRSPGASRRSPGASRRSSGASRRSSGASRRSPGASRRSPGASRRSPGASRRSSSTSRRSPDASHRFPRAELGPRHSHPNYLSGLPIREGGQTGLYVEVTHHRMDGPSQHHMDGPSQHLMDGPPQHHMDGPPQHHIDGPPQHHIDGPSQHHMDGPPQHRMDGPPQQHMDGPSQHHMDGPPQHHMDGPPQHRMDGPPQHHMVGPPQQHINGPPQHHMDGPPQQHMNGPPQHRMDGPPQQHMDGPPQQHMDGPPQHHMDGPPLHHMVGPPQQHMDTAPHGWSATTPHGWSATAPHGWSTTASYGWSITAPHGWSTTAPHGWSATAPHGWSTTASQGWFATA